MLIYIANIQSAIPLQRTVVYVWG